MHFTFAKIGETGARSGKPSIPRFRVEVRSTEGGRIMQSHEGTEPEITPHIRGIISSKIRSLGAGTYFTAAGFKAPEFQYLLNGLKDEVIRAGKPGYITRKQLV